jgi:hypothetical protein
VPPLCSCLIPPSQSASRVSFQEVSWLQLSSSD